LEAADGRATIAAFSSNPGIGLVILDVMMPDLDGWVVLKELKARSDVPVIMLTAKSEEEDELFGFGLGADEYIRKPVSPRILVARVGALLKRSVPSPPETDAALARNLEGTGISVDTGARRITAEGRELAVSPLEFKLLVLLVSRPAWS
jgi:DNA-binding response OmpR family regulator